MTICLGKSSSLCLICMSFVNVYEFVCMLLSLLVLRVGCGMCRGVLLIWIIVEHWFTTHSVILTSFFLSPIISFCREAVRHRLKYCL